ncbi:MAG: GAF domain-containing protein, partial [Euryarchaeota archaeon]|nr:GAF domain-containing protein [Euryarchaeota archaeon]
NFDICALLLLDDETNEIYVKNYYGYDKKIKDFRVSLDDPVGITAYVAVTKETYYAPNVVKDEIYLNYCSKTMSELCAPIKVGGKVLGVIDVESERKNAFLESDQQLVEALASQAAIAIENAELFKKLSSLKEFHERIVNSLNEGIWIEDRDGNCTYANPKMKKMLGYEKIVGKHWKEIVPPERREEMQKETKFRSEGRASTYESLFLTKNGEEIPVLISATPLFEDGEYSGVIAVWIDIRKKKEMEKKLSTIYDLSREMSLSLDMDHISELVLSAAKDILKFDNIDLFILNKETKELQLQRCSGLKDPDRHTTVPLFGEKGITAYVARTMESQNIPDVRKNDRYIPGLEESQSELSVPLIVRDKVIGVIDVESRKKNAFSEEDEQLLKTLASPTAIAIENARLLEKIRKYSEFQKLFISILTHDLKNPITVIKGYAEMIGNNVDERTKRCVKGIERGTKKMSTLINNVVFYSKLQEKEYKKKFEKKDLTHVIQEALEDLKEKTKEKDIEVVYGVEGRYPLNANSTLGNVFLNLLDNAIKYSPRGSRVEIGIDDRGESWSVSVKDQGEGVPDELKEVIFRRFTQKKVDVRGTGLGLTIVKQIVDLHGGRVWVEDNPEGGSVFLVELPKTTESTHNQHPKEPPT